MSHDLTEQRVNPVLSNLINGSPPLTSQAIPLSGSFAGIPLTVASKLASASFNSAQTSYLSFTPPAVSGMYRLLAVCGMNAWATPASFTLLLAYKDANGNAQSEVLGLIRGSTGASAAAVTAVDRWYVPGYVFTTDATAVAIVFGTSATTFTGTPGFTLTAVLERLA